MATVIRNQKTNNVISFLILIALIINLTAAASGPDLQSQSALLQKEISRFETIAQSGGWDKIVLKKKQYKQGESAPLIVQVKKRLQATGQLDGKDESSLFTPELETAVRKAQHQFGLKETGIIDALLVASLNVPVQTRLRQLQINLQRSFDLPADAGGRRLVVNIPEYKLHVYEGGQHVFDMNVVVGTEKNQTAIFNDEMTQVVFSPYWNVPQSIVRNEILPALRRNSRYLANNGYEKTGTENGLPVIRQKPGRNNSLGLVKFLFPNEHAIYFHDTPAKSLFKNRIRAYSHGCVRLEEPAKLAEYLLSNDPQWTPSKIAAAMNAGREQAVNLSQPVPVSIIYLTAWVDRDGVVNFRDDIYEKDKGIPAALGAASNE